MTMPGQGPLIKQTKFLTCKICWEPKEHYRWNNKALWTCPDVNSHPDVTDIRVLRTRIEELKANQEQLLDDAAAFAETIVCQCDICAVCNRINKFVGTDIQRELRRWLVEDMQRMRERRQKNAKL